MCNRIALNPFDKTVFFLFEKLRARKLITFELRDMKLFVMKRILSTLLMLFALIQAQAQPGPGFTLQGNIDNFQRPATVYLLIASGAGFDVIDSMRSKNGEVLFVANTIPKTGQYSLFWEDNFFIPLIINNEKYIQFRADNLEPNMQVEVDASRENEVFYQLQNFENEIDSLSALGDKYYAEGKKDLLQKVKKQLVIKVAQLESTVDSLYGLFPDLFALKIYKSSIPPDFDEYNKINPENGYTSETEFLRHHYFDNIDKTDSSLVNTHLLYDACSFYLRNLVEEHVPVEFIKACDFIMSSFSQNNTQYNYVLDLLLNTFDAEGYEDVYLHIFDLYMHSSSCEGGIPSEQERKALSIRNLQKGVAAPELSAKNRDGKEFSLSSFKGKKAIVMFWASDCSHCEEAIPYVVELLKKYPEVVLFSFSLDEDENAWSSGVFRNNLPDPSISDLKGYDGLNAIRWYIWGTPSFFVIDENGIIVAKPLTLQALEDAL